MSDDPEARELKEVQEDREETESEQAAEALSEDEAAQHQRRADKAAYLRGKLEERERSEQDEGD